MTAGNVTTMPNDRYNFVGGLVDGVAIAVISGQFAAASNRIVQ